MIKYFALQHIGEKSTSTKAYKTYFIDKIVGLIRIKRKDVETYLPIYLQSYPKYLYFQFINYFKLLTWNILDK